MKEYKATQFAYTVLYANNDVQNAPYPYIKDENGDKTMLSISREHGRSYIVGQNNNRYIISKGNGLSYSPYRFLNFGELGDDTMGLLLRDDASRDYWAGKEVNSFGIKTNLMEYVLEINKGFLIPQTGNVVRPYLLQYTVECPYRISDAPFMDRCFILKELQKWQSLCTEKHSSYYLMAADVLFRNLRIMHDNNILHNAISVQNYTWALELLDFELTRTPNLPYSKTDYERHVCDLYPREIAHTYMVINYIADCLRENVDEKAIKKIMNLYEYDFDKYSLHNY